MPNFVKNSRSEILVPNIIPCRHTVKSGGLEYRVDLDFIKMPEGISNPVKMPGLVVDRDGYILATKRDKRTPILEFNPDGSFSRYIAEGLENSMLHGISVNADGNLWIADCVMNNLRLIDRKTGKVLQTLEAPYSDTGFFEQPKTEEGSFNAHLTIKRRGEPFHWPTRVIEGQDGKLYVADGYGNCALHRFSHDGVLEKSWGEPGMGPGQMGILHSIWQDKLGRLWVADRESCKVTIFDTEGVFLNDLTNLAMPSDVCSDDEFIYVSEYDRRVCIYDYNYNLVGHINYVPSVINGHKIATDGKGNLFLGYKGSQHVLIRFERIG